ncbi:FMN-binding negative transcriptional regulator [Dokdonella sp. MW10]|uniref:FMN-binding negative transcriptional regulator n=1 Tax=Dokdonella sp. MW10 TaxID=2992926 RepID=UPI003F7F9BA1
MYLPAAFRESREPVLEDLARAHPLATLVSLGLDGLSAEHVPLVWADGVLRGHVARANAIADLDGTPVLAMFHGPEGYVSPNWYPGKAATGREVPTWNYAVVHVHGVLRVVDDAAWLRDVLGELTDVHEAGEPQPWSIDDAPEDYVQALLRAIVGIRIEPSRIEGKFKLGQNKPVETVRRVAEALERRDGRSDAALAALTRQALEARA